MAKETLQAEQVRGDNGRMYVRFDSGLRALREKKQLSINDCAVIMGLTCDFLGKVERGDQNATEDTVKRIEEFYKVDVIITPCEADK